jgi:3-hydroxybutyryl-CoA dehydrogenase
MSNYIVLITADNPWYEKFTESDALVFDMERDEPFEGRKSEYRNCDAIIDLANIDPERKLSFLKYLDFEFQKPIISDLTLYWGDFYLEQIANLEGAVSLLFHAEGNSFEAYKESEVASKAIEWISSVVGKKELYVSRPGIGFTYPRTLVMIINEAFFALEDGMATPEDMDRAMKYGVNYPAGPFEWLSKIGPKPILQLLDELFNVTGEPRYRASKLLRLEANQYEV